MTKNLFVYGLLRDNRKVKLITGKNFKTISSTLKGFKRYRPSSLPHPFKLAKKRGKTLRLPFILPKKGKKVYGKLILNIDKKSLNKIDSFEKEGFWHIRKEVNVYQKNKRKLAFVYIGNKDFFKNYS